MLKLFSPDDCAARYLSINPGLTLLAAVTESRALIRHKTEDLSFLGLAHFSKRHSPDTFDWAVVTETATIFCLIHCIEEKKLVYQKRKAKVTRQSKLCGF